MLGTITREIPAKTMGSLKSPIKADKGTEAERDIKTNAKVKARVKDREKEKEKEKEKASRNWAVNLSPGGRH